MQQLQQVVIGVDPHKLSATIEVVDAQERLLGGGRFTTDRAGYTAMRAYAKTRSANCRAQATIAAPQPQGAAERDQGASGPSTAPNASGARAASATPPIALGWTGPAERPSIASCRCRAGAGPQRPGRAPPTVGTSSTHHHLEAEHVAGRTAAGPWSR